MLSEESVKLRKRKKKGKKKKGNGRGERNGFKFSSVVSFSFLFLFFFFFPVSLKSSEECIVTLRERARKKESAREKRNTHSSDWRLAFEEIRRVLKLTRESPVFYACVSCVSSTCFPFPALFQPPDSPTKKQKERKKENRITWKEVCKTRCSKQQTFRPRTIRSFTDKNCVSMGKEEKMKKKAYGQGHRSI